VEGPFQEAGWLPLSAEDQRAYSMEAMVAEERMVWGERALAQKEREQALRERAPTWYVGICNYTGSLEKGRPISTITCSDSDLSSLRFPLKISLSI
jgi:hypothetical protein